jgi:hypothetical protein
MNNTTNFNPGTVKEAEHSIKVTLIVGFIIGAVGLIGYPVTLSGIGVRIIFIGLLLSIATFVSGFFIGTLFGMPKRNNEGDGDYSLNNSLVEISDWLTKIIVGLGLVNLKEIPVYLMSIGDFVSSSSGLKGVSIEIFTVTLVIYFGILGLYSGYNYMRLVLSEKYKKADDNMLKKELETAKEEVVQKNKEADLLKEHVIQKDEQTKALLNLVNQPDFPIENLKSTLVDFDYKESDNGEIGSANAMIDNMIATAKIKLENGHQTHKDDPQKGQWNGKATNNNRQLTATISEISNWLFKIQTKVCSTDPDKYPLKDGEIVLFALHDTYGDPPFRIVKAEDGCASLELISYGSFTIGAYADMGKTELELDLAELPGVSDYFKTH